MDVLSWIGDGLWNAFRMAWEVGWALILGFALSGVVQAWIPRSRMQSALGARDLRTVSLATGLGAASSSCSYAAVAIAKSMLQKGASLVSAMAFQFASTNLVIELGIIMWLLLGWQFTLGEFVGGPLMIVLVAVGFRLFLQRRLVDEAREQANRGLVGSMEGHAEMDMSAGGEGSWWQRLRTPRGFTATADYFVMDWAAIWRDIFVGLLVAGALAAWVPESWWQSLFLVDHPTAAKVWGPVVGPLVAVISFVCSVGNVPLAAVLWNGGISFGGVIAFIFGDLIIAPILNIYRKYYGLRMAAFLAVVLYVTMVLAGLAVELLFQAFGIVPTERNAKVEMASVTWNYTTYLNIVFLALAALLVWRYFRRGGGIAMLRMMNRSAGTEHDHHACHHPEHSHG
jgi:uncharacterized membrane protein YraQ (UPF0718 family)